MAKSKRSGPPLFELLQGNRFRRGEVGPPPDLRVVHHESETDEDETVAPSAKVRYVDSENAGTIRPDSNAIVKLSGDRLHVSLTPFSAAIGVFVVSLIVLGAIAIGQRRGEKAGFLRAISTSTSGESNEIDAVETLRNQPPDSRLVEGLLANDSKSTSPPRETERAARKAQPAALQTTQTEPPAGPQQGWVRDYTYIMAQEFASGRDADAQRAQEFLAAREIPAKVVKLDSGALQLITLEGYNHKDPAQKKKADELLKKQRAAGAEYFASGGGYKLEGYYKTLKKDQW